MTGSSARRTRTRQRENNEQDENTESIEKDSDITRDHFEEITGEGHEDRVIQCDSKATMQSMNKVIQCDDKVIKCNVKDTTRNDEITSDKNKDQQVKNDDLNEQMESNEMDFGITKDQCDGKDIIHNTNNAIQCNDKKGETMGETRRSRAGEKEYSECRSKWATRCGMS